jgi:hypothetical protein
MVAVGRLDGGGEGARLAGGKQRKGVDARAASRLFRAALLPGRGRSGPPGLSDLVV